MAGEVRHRAGKLLKIGALVRLTVRKVWVSLAGGYPFAELFARSIQSLMSLCDTRKA